MAFNDGIHRPRAVVSAPIADDFRNDEDELTPVHSQRGVLATGQQVQPRNGPVDEYTGEGFDSVEQRIMALEHKIGLNGSVWRDWTALRRSSLSIPNINNPFVRQHTINQERLRFLHHLPELRDLPDGGETTTNVWVGLYAGMIISVDADILNPYPSCAPVFLTLRKQGQDLQLLDAETSLLQGNPEHTHVWFEIAALKKVLIKPFGDVDGEMTASEIRAVKRYNQAQLENLLYFNADVKRLAQGGEFECDVGVDPYTAMVRDLSAPAGNMRFMDLLGLRLYIMSDDNGYMGYFTDTSKLVFLHSRAQQVDLVRSFVRRGNIMTFEPPPEYEVLKAVHKGRNNDVDSLGNHRVRNGRIVEGFITEDSVTSPDALDMQRSSASHNVRAPRRQFPAIRPPAVRTPIKR